MRQIIIDTGALKELELMIEEMTLKAHQALSSGGITPQAATLLDEMAVAATRRSS